MRRIEVAAWLPTKIDLVEEWALEMEPRSWHLNVDGHPHTVTYSPASQQAQQWQIRHGQSTTLYGPTLQDALMALAQRWHDTLLMHYLRSAAAQQLDAIEAEQGEPDIGDGPPDYIPGD